MPRNKGESKLPNALKKKLQQQQRGRKRERTPDDYESDYDSEDDVRMPDIIAIVNGTKTWAELLRNPIFFEFDIYNNMDWLKELWKTRPDVKKNEQKKNK
jgi:hypothetical protein